MFARRAEWRPLGIRADELHKPKVAIVNSSSDLAACFAHLDDIVPVLVTRHGTTAPLVLALLDFVDNLERLPSPPVAQVPPDSCDLRQVSLCA